MSSGPSTPIRQHHSLSRQCEASVVAAVLRQSPHVSRIQHEDEPLQRAIINEHEKGRELGKGHAPLPHLTVVLVMGSLTSMLIQQQETKGESVKQD